MGGDLGAGGDEAHSLIIEKLNHIWAGLDISSINDDGDQLESILGGSL